MRFLRTWVVVLPWLVGCSFDFAPFNGGAGGAAASSSNGSGSVTTTSTGKATGSSTSSAGPGATTGTGTSSSSTSTGGPSVLTECGGLADTFATFDTNTWSSHASVFEAANHLHTKIDTGNGYAEAFLKAKAQYDECYASVAVVDYPSSTIAYLGVEDQNGMFEEVAYDKSKNELQAPQLAGFDPGFEPDGLGIAFHAGSVHFLYHHGGAWTDAQSIPRDAWMNDGANDTIAIGVGPGANNLEGAFDDFNVHPITVADLK